MTTTAVWDKNLNRYVTQHNTPPATPKGHGRFGVMALRGGKLHHGFRSYPVTGAHATVDNGAPQSRMTGTRVLVGTAILPGVGTLLGGMSRKNTTRVYVTVTLADGQVLTADDTASHERAAHKFAATVNTASATR